MSLESAGKSIRNIFFREDGLAMNPYKGCEILFLPEDILHERPIVKCRDNIDRVVSVGNSGR